MLGGDGKDNLYGGDGADSLFGGTATDWLRVALNDIIDGGIVTDRNSMISGDANWVDYSGCAGGR